MDVDHMSITVSNLDRSIEFYQRCFGFRVLSKNEYDVGNLVSMGLTGVRMRVAHLTSTNGPDVEFIEYVSPRGEHRPSMTTNNVGTPHLAFFSEDIDADYARLVQEGARFNAPPGGSRDAPLRSIYGFDPDGIPFEIVQRPGQKPLSSGGRFN
jgi:catechol 2,3-dioxygenase-like lactoylglutathione lyase family enzyme